MSLMDFLHSRAELRYKKSETYLRQQESAAKIRHLEAERRRPGQRQDHNRAILTHAGGVMRRSDDIDRPAYA